MRSDFTFPLPQGLDEIHVASLLCAGIIGFRSLRVAGVQPGERVGLFGFGSSATLAIPTLQSWDCEMYIVTRGAAHRATACKFDATWVGREDDRPPVSLDRAITFAPSGKVIVDALSSLRKGGVVAINAIHLDQMSAFDYDKLLWGERQIRSVANMTREDAHDFLKIAHALKIQPRVTTFKVEDANKALLAVKDETENGSAMIVLLKLHYVAESLTQPSPAFSCVLESARDRQRPVYGQFDPAAGHAAPHSEVPCGHGFCRCK